MTDWSRLTHAYGTAEDVPPLLDRLATDPDDGTWSELWSSLCHQGSTYSASYAALPRLADLARDLDEPHATQAVTLAGAIVAGGGEAVLEEHAEAAGRLLAVANGLLPDADEDTYAYLLECVLAFEGVAYWQDALAWGVTEEEYEVECEECGANLAISTAQGTCAEDGGGSTSLRPADPTTLDGVGGRLHGLATAHGQAKVARVLVHVFGGATCPSCGTEFVVADQVLA
ncbi:hypothetical protein ADK67_04335 [Saccharothrix sp. NRRL B-16348]|uniref:hypothetical protein n=1 Tax=Saccharothrix sp. NRRL B-16348 TaxID=1415542 RepID=UPI0006BFBE87|nr:hypothetical protein [Saccharothrix sp. NRRL B-16348]KOX34236.1 hypothetical protein ADK67_04335 [Saccharothrix sp. NRRL B-16348]